VHTREMWEDKVQNEDQRPSCSEQPYVLQAEYFSIVSWLVA
jgi:hypothetical protein